MTFEIAYNSQPASGFTDYVTPIQPPDVSGNPTTYVIPGFNSTEYIPPVLHHSEIAPNLANLVSELFAISGTALGSIGGWKHSQLKTAIIEDTAASEPKAALLPAVRLVKNQLTECFGWLPLWQNPTCRMALQLGEKYTPKLIPAARGGLVGGITGTIAGYIAGYLAGSAADWCVDRFTER
jgi:hypothetical protein